jgi:two-component system chemotaxis response regulator CheY
MIKRVLIADDSGVGRKLTRRCLEFAGLGGREFVEAGNGQVALTMIEAGGIDLLVTDINMPVMDGLELLRALSELPEQPKLLKVVMSSAASAALKTDLARYGVLAVIEKPVSPAAFGKVLSPHVGA